MTIGQRISDLRRKYSYSQEYVAEKIGVSRQAVSKWEQDQAAPDTYNLIALAELFHVTVEYLAVGKTDEPPPEEKSRPATQSEMPMEKIVGVILLGVGLLSLILGMLFSEDLMLLSLWLLWGGGVCICPRRNQPLFTFWSGMVVFGAMASFGRKGWLFAFYNLQFPRYLNMATVTSFIFWIALIIGTVFTVKTFIARAKRKQKNSES